MLKNKTYADLSIIEIEYRLNVALNLLQAEANFQEELAKIHNFKNRFQLIVYIRAEAEKLRNEYLARCEEIGVFKCLL